jgi:phage terminase small subunit
MEPFVPGDNAGVSPIEPPRDIPAKVRELADELLASQPPNHWRRGDEYLLEGYCQAIIAGREAFEHLQSEGYVKGGRANPWIQIWEKATRASTALCARLRLSPSARHDAKAADRERHRNKLGNPITPVRGWPARRVALDDEA